MLKQPGAAGTVLIVAGIFIASNLYTMLPVQAYLADTYSISFEATSMASFFFIFFYAWGLLTFGILADQYDEKKILTYGMLILSILTFIIPFAPTYSFFLAARAVQGILAASFAPAAFSYVFRNFEGKTQTISIALINTGFLFAGIFGQILSAFFVFSFSFHTLFYAFSGIYFTCFILLMITLMNSKKRNDEQSHLLLHIVTLIRQQPLRKLYLTTFFLLFTVMLFYGGFEIFLATGNEAFPFSLQTFRFIGLIGIFPAFFASRLEVRFGPVSVLVTSLLLMSAGFLFPIVYLHEWTLIIASICMIGSTSLTIPMVILLVGRFAGEAKGRAISVYSFTLLTGASIGSVCAALIPFQEMMLGIVTVFAGLAFVTHTLKKDQALDAASYHNG